jgi:hypothetical protein
MDLFDFFRRALATVVTIYATLVTGQSLLGWYRWLNEPQQYISILRRYVVISGLRLKFSVFWTDVVICVLLCVTFVLLFHAHGIVGHVAGTLADAHRKLQPPRWRGD